MLVYLHRYREEDAAETVESDGEVADTDAEEYFGKEELAPEDDWERVEYGDGEILRLPETYEGVTEISVPRDIEEPSALPGETIQLLIDGENTFVEGARIVEVTDEDP